MPLSKAKIRWGYVLSFFLLLISYLLVFYIIGLQVKETSRLTHSYTVINNLESIKSEITDAETGIRGFVITKEERFLQPYHSGVKNVQERYAELRRLMADNKAEAAKLDLLNQLLQRRLALMEYSLKTFQQNGLQLSDDIRANRESSKSSMDSVRLLVSELKQQEYAVMNERNQKLRSFFTGTEIITVTSLLIAIITFVYSLIIYNRGARAREKSDENARNYSVQLEDRVKELRKLNIELEELKSMEKFTSTGRIARTIAHEVRNPLTNISLASEQLKEITNGNAEADLLLDMVGRNVVRINQLVSDLLQSTRFAQLEYGPVDMNELMDSTLELAADRVELNHIIVEKHYGKDLCEIWVDQEKIQLAFLNIIVNAIEAMEKGTGVLQVWTYKQGDKCIIEFRDNGNGMDDETMQRLFEPYFTGKPKGNGLGLTNTQNIILNHKGNINVRSKIGKGSTFIVTLHISQGVPV